VEVTDHTTRREAECEAHADEMDSEVKRMMSDFENWIEDQNDDKYEYGLLDFTVLEREMGDIMDIRDPANVVGQCVESINVEVNIQITDTLNSYTLQTRLWINDDGKPVHHFKIFSIDTEVA